MKNLKVFVSVISLFLITTTLNAQTVTAQTTTVPGKGTLVLAADGSYTFTPVAGFTGPVNFVYITCDNGVPQACASATLYVLVSPAPPTPNLTPIIEYLPSITHGTQQISIVTTVAEIKGVNTNGVITVYVARDPKYTIIWNPAATTAGAFQCPAGQNHILCQCCMQSMPDRRDEADIYQHCSLPNSFERFRFHLCVSPGQRICPGLAVFRPPLFIEDFYPERISLPS